MVTGSLKYITLWGLVGLNSGHQVAAKSSLLHILGLNPSHTIWGPLISQFCILHGCQLSPTAGTVPHLKPLFHWCCIPDGVLRSQHHPYLSFWACVVINKKGYYLRRMGISCIFWIMTVSGSRQDHLESVCVKCGPWAQCWRLGLICWLNMAVCSVLLRAGTAVKNHVPRACSDSQSERPNLRRHPHFPMAAKP